MYNLQKNRWDPLIQWFCDRFQVDIIKTCSIEAPKVTLDTKDVITKHLLSYNFEAIHGKMIIFCYKKKIDFKSYK